MADTTMTSLKDTLRNTMEKLSLADFKKFKHRLSDISQVPWSGLERMDCDETLDLIVETYTEELSSQVVAEILKHMNLDQMAKDMEKKLNGDNLGLESQSTGGSRNSSRNTDRPLPLMSGGSRNSSRNTDSPLPLISDGSSLIPDLRILLLGYRGSGKSSSGNTILGRQEFDTSVRTSPCVKRQGEVAGRRITLVEPPGWWRSRTLDGILEFDRRELILSLSLCAPGPHAVLLPIDLNHSFIELYRQSIQGHLKLFGDQIWRHIIILFTHGDWLGNNTIEQHIESAGEPLQWLFEKCGRRYHVLNNENPQNDGCQVQALLTKIECMVAGSRGAYFEFDRRVLRELEEKKEEDARRARRRMLRVQAQRENLRPPEGGILHTSDLRIVLVGYRVGGKSTVGNLILGRQEFVPAKRTACCVKREGNVAGRKVTLVEAPGWWKGYSINDTPERDKREIVLSMSLCPPGPHALLLVVDVTDPFVEEQKNALQHHLELLGETVWSHTMVVFTRGGWIGHTPIEHYIDSDKQSLQWLVEKCGNRYHVLCKYRQEKVQVTELLKKVEELVAGNSGQHFDFDNKILQNLEDKKKEDERKAKERRMRVQKQRESIKSLAGGLSNTDLRIVLLGYRGSGKSSSGNTILGRHEFITSLRTFPCVKKQGRTAGRRVTLVEAVGWVVWHSVENTPARDQQELIRSVSLCPPEPHALLLVLSVSLTFREDHRAAVQEHLELLGEDVWGHTMVLFTRGDWLGDTTIEEHIESGGEALKWVVEKCGNRYHVLNNLNRQDRAQVSELLQKVQEMVGNNNIHFMVERSMELKPDLKEQHSADTRALGAKEPEHKEEPSLKTEDDHSKHKSHQLRKALQNKISFVDASKITVCTDSLIGSGGFGKVYKGHYQGTPAAIKIMEIDEGPMTECFVPIFLSHPNIVRMMAFTKKDNQILMANEYINGANLHQVLYSQTTIKLDIKEKLQVAFCIAMAVEFIHEKNIIHQDLKPANILIAKDSKTAFLTDWGLAKLRESMIMSRGSRGSGGRLYGPSGGTVTYMSPECLVDCEDCSTMSDMWALGVTLLEMLAGAIPWTFSSVQELRRLLKKQQPPEGLDKLQPSHQDIVKALLDYDLKSRMNATNLVASLKLLID